MFIELSFHILGVQQDHDTRYGSLSHLVSRSGADERGVR